MVKTITTVLLIAASLFGQMFMTGCSEESPKKESDFNVPILETKETTLKSITYAVMYDKSELFWNCLAEDTKIVLLESAKKVGRTEDIAKKEVFLWFKKDFQKIMRKHDNDPDQVVDALLKGNVFPLEQINKKWYLLLDGMIARNDQIAHTIVKYSTKESLVSDFINGIIGSNHELVWECISAHMQEKIRKRKDYLELNEDEIRERFVKEMKPVVDNELEKNDFDADKTINAFAQKAYFVKIGNRWYYQAE